MSQRKSIRHEARDLVASVTGLDGGAHASRSLPVDGDDAAALPVALVYTDRDPADKVDGYRKKRNLALRIVVIVRNDSAADDILDDICERIEQKFETAISGELTPEPAIAAMVESMEYVDTVLTYSGEEGRQDFVHAEMTYAIAYIRVPTQAFEDLVTAQIDIDMANPRNDPQDEVGPDGQLDASATVILNP